jgi:hypothetical protein
MFAFSLSQLHEHCKHFPAATDTHSAIEELLQMEIPVLFVYLTHRGSAENWDSAVSTATEYGLDDQEVGVRVRLSSRFFPFPAHSD